MNERNISVKKIFIILFSFIWMQNSILSYFRGIIDNINYLTEIYDIVNILIIIILLLLLIPNVVRNISFKNVFFCFAFIVIFVLSFNNNLVSEYVDENFYHFLLEIFPFYFLGIFLFKLGNRQLYKVLYVISNISIVLSITYLFYFIYTGRSWAGVDQMNMAYSNLIYILYSIWYSMTKKSKISFLILVTALVFLLALGNRGSLLITFIWYIICLFKYSKSNKVKFAFVGLVVILLVLYFVGVTDIIMNGLGNVFKFFNFNIRIFDYLSKKNLFDENGRTAILTLAINSIKLSPYRFNGFYYDRVVAGVYVHNLLFELWLDFGIIIGTIFIAWIIIKCFFAVKNSTNYTRDFILLLIVFMFTKLMMSSSFLQEPYFFLLLGLISNISKKGVFHNEKNIVKSICEM